jgi:hypothetical protein
MTSLQRPLRKKQDHRCKRMSVRLRGRSRLVLLDYRLSARMMQRFVASCTEGNQVFLGIVPAQTPQFLVVDLQVFSGATDLASPAIASKYFFSELLVELGVKPQPRLFGSRQLAFRRRGPGETVRNSIVQPGCTKHAQCRRISSSGRWRRN